VSGPPAVRESPGRSAAQIVAAATGRCRGVPAWPQLPRDRTTLTYLGRHAAAVACRRLGIGPGDEVLMPSYNCGVEVEAVLSVGASVVLYRVDHRLEVDVEDVRLRITPWTRAVYATHGFAGVAPLRELRGLCREFGLFLIEDCALALFASDTDGLAGRDADAAVFSFKKTLPVPDGGALVLRRPWPQSPREFVRPSPSRVLRRTLGLLRRPGRCGPACRTAPRRPDMPDSYYWDKTNARWSISRMTLGILAQIDPPWVVARRRANYERLCAGLEGAPGVKPLVARLPDGACPVALPVVSRERDRLVDELRRRGVAAVAWWAGFHRGLPWDDFPEACRLKNSVVALPVHQDLDVDAVDRVARAVVDAARATSPSRPAPALVAT